MSKHTAVVTLDLGELGETEVTVNYSYSPAVPGRQFLKNGDPGYPDEPAELEVLSLAYEGIILPQSFWACGTSAIKEALNIEWEEAPC